MLNIIFILLAPFTWAGPQEEAYFKSFTYAVEGSCEDPDFGCQQQHRYLMDPNVENPVKIPVSDTQSFSTSAELFLMPDGTYTFIYHEYLYFDPKNPSIFAPYGCKYYKGTWSVPNQELVLSGGEGTGTKAYFKDKSQDGVLFTFAKDLKGANLAGYQLKMTLGYSNVGPNDMATGPFCSDGNDPFNSGFFGN